MAYSQSCIIKVVPEACLMQLLLGVILHPTSLPGPYGTGEIGKEAFKFVDWIASTGMQLWQVLPLVPPEEQYWSPYAGEHGTMWSASMSFKMQQASNAYMACLHMPHPMHVIAKPSLMWLCICCIVT